MGSPDCGTCEMLGYRSCDSCGSPAWAGRRGYTEPNLFSVLGMELCACCCPDQRRAVWE